MSRAITLAVFACALVVCAHAMTDAEAEGILSGRIREWPIPANAETEPLTNAATKVGAAASCTCGSAATMSNEGSRPCCYYDSVGVPTIGVGHNLKTNPSALAKYGLNANTVISTCGKYTSYKAGYCLTASQITDLFSIDFAPAQACAKELTPSAPPCVMAAMADMCFNLGKAGLAGFPNMLRDVNSKKYSDAAYEAGNSLWCKQVGSRCARDQACIRTGA